MSTQKDGGSAFPKGDGLAVYGNSGMSLRDWFAGQALTELIRLSMGHDGGWSMDTAAQGAYEMADAMIRNRGAQGES